MSSSPSASRPAVASTLALALALLAALLLAPAQTLAQGHRTGCAARSAAHVGAKARRAKCQVRGGRSAHKNARRHAVKRAAKAHSKHTPAALPLTPATCADETAPVRAGGGSFSCDDGSEPSCENESDPIRSGHTLACVGEPAAGEPGCEEAASGGFCMTGSGGGGEPVCEDGSTPDLGGCDDGSEPVCEDGSAPFASGEALSCSDAFSES